MVTCRSRYSNNDLVKTYNDLPHKCMEFKGNKNNLTKGDVSKVIKNKIIWIINLQRKSKQYLTKNKKKITKNF